jgi:hypothetical protein
MKNTVKKILIITGSLYSIFVINNVLTILSEPTAEDVANMSPSELADYYEFEPTKMACLSAQTQKDYIELGRSLDSNPIPWTEEDEHNMTDLLNKIYICNKNNVTF